MSNKQVVSVKSKDIEELMSLLAIKFESSKSMGVDMLLLCFVVGELCVKVECANWPYNESFKRSIKEFRKMARGIADEIYQAGADFDLTSSS